MSFSKDHTKKTQVLGKCVIRMFLLYEIRTRTTRGTWEEGVVVNESRTPERTTTSSVSFYCHTESHVEVYMGKNDVNIFRGVS